MAAVAGPVEANDGPFTLYDVLDYLIDNSSMGGGAKYKLNNAVNVLRQGESGPIEPLAVSTSTLQAGAAGATYAAVLSASGGVSPYSWQAAGLPAGLGVSQSGVISGVVASAADSEVTVTVIDSSVPPQQADAVLSLVVA